MDGFGYQMKKGQSFHRGKSSADIRADRRTTSAQDSGSEWALRQQSLGMSWLYRMISTIHISGDHAFSDDSRTWLARRVDSADTSAVQERRTSVWWEHQQRTPAPAPLSLEVVKEDEEKEAATAAAAAAASVIAPPKSPAAVATPAPHAGSHTGSISLPQLTLQHILDTPVFLSDFRQHLEENFCEASINFLEAFQTWSEIDPKAYPRKFIKQARYIYEQYIDPSGEEIVSIPSDIRAKVEEVTRGALGIKTKKKMDVEVFAPLRNVMEDAKKSVLHFIESNLYPRFLKSEDYQEMLAVRFEDDSESKGAAAVYKGQPWDNSAGYKSLQITLMSAKGVSTNRKAWSLLTVDSRSYKTNVASPSVPGEAAEKDDGEEADGPVCAITPQKIIEWNETFEFPIISTTQYLKMTLLTRGLIDNSIFMGRAFVNIAQIQEANGQPITVKLMPRTYQDKVSGEVTISAKLRVEEATDLGHQVAQDEDNTFAVADAIRGLVSKKKKRFQDDGFDLDLSYITDRIIAMGFPAEGFEGVFRNNAEDVLRFFERRHPLSYKLYNLCSERSYDPAKFKGRVSRYPFDDHNPPTIDQIKDFCLDVHEWLETHPQHVVAIHCKAGKGRTGTVIACYLIYARMCPDAASALQFFAVKRTKNAKGVTIPSQIRYVHYFEHYCRLRRSGLPAPPKASLFLKEIILHNVPKSVQSGEVFFNLTQNNRKALQYKSKGHLVPKMSFREVVETDKKGKQKKKNQCKISFSFGRKPILLTEDVNFEFHHTTTFGKEKMFQFWLNTRYTVSINAAQEVETKVKAHAEANPHERFAQWKEARGSAIIPADEETSGNPDAETKEAEEEEDANEEVDPKALPADRLPYIGALSSMVDPTDWREENLRLVFDKWSVDKICKDTKNKNYPSDFKVELVFLHSKHSSQVQQLTVAFAEPAPAAIDQAHDLAPGSITPGGDSVTPGGDASPPIKPAVPELKIQEEKLSVPDASTSPRASPRGDKKDAQHKAQGPQTTFKIGKLLSVTLPKPAS